MGKSVRLTDAGRVFFNEARAILKGTNEAVVKARVMGGKREAELQVGDFPLAAARIMPGLLRNLSKGNAGRAGEAARLAGGEGDHRSPFATASYELATHHSSAYGKLAPS